jgi:hypothetical protein
MLKPLISGRTGALAAACALVLATASLTGCKTAPPPLYDWGPYQAKVYEQFKGTGNGPEAQISELEEHLAEAESAQHKVPPGYLAHLGYLHLIVGHNDRAAQYWTQEKTTYPESAKFMDFLIKNLKKQEAKQ